METSGREWDVLYKTTDSEHGDIGQSGAFHTKQPTRDMETPGRVGCFTRHNRHGTWGQLRESEADEVLEVLTLLGGALLWNVLSEDTGVRWR